jgi:hypothetical protein
MLILTDQQGGVFDAETFEETVFETGVVWRRQEPDVLGWARQADPAAGGYGASAYGGGLYGVETTWTRLPGPTDGWVRV